MKLAELRKRKKRSFSKASVSPVTAIALEQKMFAMWEEEKATSGYLPTAVPVDFMRTKRQELNAAQVVGHCVLHESQGGALCKGALLSLTSEPLSPTSRRCQTPPRSSFGIDSLLVSALDSSSCVSSSPIQLAEPEFVSAFQVLDRVSSSNRVNFEGRVFDTGPRLVPIKNQKSGSESNEPFVMNAHLFDPTGPVMLTLWVKFVVRSQKSCVSILSFQ